MLELAHLYYVEAMTYPQGHPERARLLQVAIDINRKARR